jgi:nicotinate-nucleotide adenylyltransferase
MRLGIFGGSFDPVHHGHLALARACLNQAALDEVWFLPTAVQPLKRGGPRASDADRVAMLEMAISEEPRWKVCRLEIDRGGLSYTVDTLRQIHAELPDAAIFLLMGADTVRDVPRWKEPADIFRLATPLVVSRAGEPEPDLTALAKLCAADRQPQRIAMPAMDASSTEIRRRASACEPIEQLAPQAVAAYIAEHGIYQ